MDEYFLDVQEIFTGINSIIDKKMKDKIEEQGYLNSAWALNVGFSALFSSMISFLDILQDGCEADDDVKNVIGKVKDAFIDCSDLNKIFQKKYENVSVDSMKSAQ